MVYGLPFRSRGRARRGITFIELMVVLIIIMAFVTLSFPAMQGMHKKGKMAAAARELALTASLARQQAILRNHTVELHIDFKTDRYWIVLHPQGKKRVSYGSGGDEKEEVEDVHELADRKSDLHIESVQSATDPFGSAQTIRIKFFKDGSASPSIVLLADEKPRYMTVEIAGATGNVRAYEGKPANWTEPAANKRGRGAR